MVAGYQRPQLEELDGLKHQLEAILQRLRELEAADGMQTYNALVELRNQVENLATEIENVASSGAVWMGGVSAGAANVTTTSGDFYTPHGRATPVVSSYVAAYLNVDGRIGATVSSLRYKQDIESAGLSEIVEALRRVALVRFRYIDAVERLGDDAPSELGGIAEYFFRAGLEEWVYLDADGEPQGIAYERLTIPLIGAFQELDRRTARLETENAELRDRLNAAGI